MLKFNKYLINTKIKTKMKKIFSLLLIITFLISFIPQNSFASVETKETYFIVTAYYSPLPNQKFYLKWNYKAEKRLNWEGIRWASGKNVFSWMLAAPKGYKFGTKIYLEWLGIGEVADRWWAIVHAWNRGYKYDRIDLWVGYWDEGLKRALYWGKRKIKWKIVSKNSKITINYNKIPAPTWATKGLKKISNIFNTPLWVGSNPSQVRELQKFLQKIGLYKGKIDWIYNNKIIDIIYNFQVKNKLIKPKELYWAWYWGYKTRNLFLKKYLNWDFDWNKNIIITKNIPKKELSIFKKPLKTLEETKQLQKILKELNLYYWEINWSYSDIKNIILDFQLKNKIIKSKNELWAGYFWPKTRAKLKEKYEEYQKKLDLKKQEEKRKKELEKKFKQLQELSLKQAKKEIFEIWVPKFWEVSPRVRELQKKLKLIGYFDYKDTAIFWNITKNSIIRYQLDKKIIKSKNELWAWHFWPKTREQFEKDLANIILNMQVKQDKTLAEFISKKSFKKEEITQKIENKKVSQIINKKDYLQVMLQIEKRLII